MEIQHKKTWRTAQTKIDRWYTKRLKTLEGKNRRTMRRMCKRKMEPLCFCASGL